MSDSDSAPELNSGTQRARAPRRRPSRIRRTLEPLKGIEIEIEVDGVTVTGIIEFVVPNDMDIVITSHGSGRRNGTHVSHYGMPAMRLADHEDWKVTALTARGQKVAESLLRELYQDPRLTQVAGMRATIEP